MSGENHHIIPRSIRPDLAKDKSNIVRLTYREHYIAHLLLTKLYPEGREHWLMVCALQMMCYNKFDKLSSYEYEIARRFRSDAMKGNSFHLGKQLSAEQKKYISQKTKEAMANLPEEKKERIRMKTMRKTKPNERKAFD